MSEFVFSEDDLKRAASTVYMTMLDSLPSPSECEHEFSAPFLKKMKRLTRRADHPMRYSALKAAACFLIVMLLAGCSVLAISSEAREAFVGWTRQVFENFFEYHYTGEAAEAPENTVYLPTWLPDDFEIFHESYRTGEVKVDYQTKDGHLAHFFYYSDSEGIVTGGTGESKHQQVYVGGHLADLYIDKREGENNALVWHDEERQALFSIFAPLSGDELIKIAESVEPVNCVLEDGPHD